MEKWPQNLQEGDMVWKRQNSKLIVFKSRNKTQFLNPLYTLSKKYHEFKSLDTNQFLSNYTDFIKYDSLTNTQKPLTKETLTLIKLIKDNNI